MFMLNCSENIALILDSLNSSKERELEKVNEYYINNNLMNNNNLTLNEYNPIQI